MKTILTCFAGRKHNLEILFEYVDLLVCSNLIESFHIWDFTKYEADVIYIQQQAQKRNKYEIKKVNNKNVWSDYYKYYSQEGFEDTVIVKCDDDIVYMDISQFQNFIEYTVDHKEDNLLIFPSIVNNGVCAYYQQQNNIIPESFDVFPYDTFNGKLWESGRLCQKLHTYFIKNIETWIEKTKLVLPIQHTLGDRFSINLFAIHTDNIDCFKYLHTPTLEDEHILTVIVPPIYNKHCAIYMPFTVAHLAFCKQRTCNLDENCVLLQYRDLLVDLEKYDKKTCIVISRFNEDINWIDTNKYNVVIYNKSSCRANINYINLDNVGRESHTYIHYIIHNFHQLPNIVVFLQANPFDHTSSIGNLILEAEKYGMSQNKFAYNVGKCSAYANFKIYIHNKQRVIPFKLNNTDLNYGDWYTYVTGKSFPKNPIEWYIGGCFAATKERIQSVPLETWAKIYKTLSYSSNPMTGHFMERSWYLLMNS